jgi:hypothetical protein
MPNQYWHHACERCDAIEGGRACRRCGVDGTFAGWGLSMWEAAAVYRYVYELNPFGPHRPFANRVLTPLRERCVQCGGKTILTVDDRVWLTCLGCEGTGGVWMRPTEEVEAVRHQVIERWPGAALPWIGRRSRRA